MFRKENRSVNAYAPLIVAFVMAFMIQFYGCGGGGGSSSSTSSGASAANCAYAGTYKGTATLTAYYADETGTDQSSVVAIIDNNGNIDMAILRESTGDVDCDVYGDKLTLSGTSFSGSASGNCTFEDGTVCTVSATISGGISGDVMSGSYDIIYHCEEKGDIYANIDFTLTKE